jgi:hypothetical protein
MSMTTAQRLDAVHLDELRCWHVRSDSLNDRPGPAARLLRDSAITARVSGPSSSINSDGIRSLPARHAHPYTRLLVLVGSAGLTEAPLRLAGPSLMTFLDHQESRLMYSGHASAAGGRNQSTNSLFQLSFDVPDARRPCGRLSE